VSHDSSRFYTSRLYEGIRKAEEAPYLENPVPEDCLNRIFIKSSERMEELPDNSIHLMVTSPPYNASKEYDQDLNLIEYRQFLSRVWQETYRVLVPGGRACVNIANLGRKPYLPLHSYVIEDMVSVGFLMRGEIIWNKGSSASPSTA
jgi:DNA modification methylase